MPSLLVLVSRGACVAALVALTCALATTPPLKSRTIPLSTVVGTCARALPHSSANPNRIPQTRIRMVGAIVIAVPASQKRCKSPGLTSVQTHPCTARRLRRSAGQLLSFRWASGGETRCALDTPMNWQDYTDSPQARQYSKNTIPSLFPEALLFFLSGNGVSTPL